MIPTEIRNVETKIAESNKKKFILAFFNFAGMVFAAWSAVGKEMALQNEFKNAQEAWKEDLGFESDEGQLISKCPLVVFKYPKKPTQFLDRFLPYSPSL